LFRSLLVFNFLFLTSFAQEEILKTGENIDKAINQVSYEPNWFSMLFGLIILVMFAIIE